MVLLLRPSPSHTSLHAVARRQLCTIHTHPRLSLVDGYAIATAHQVILPCSSGSLIPFQLDISISTHDLQTEMSMATNEKRKERSAGEWDRGNVRGGL